MIKYRAIHFQTLGAKIEEVEVTRETSSMVYLATSKRESKKTEWHSYHPTWEAAHATLTAHAEDQLRAARRRLQQAQGYHGNIKGMKKPETAEA